VVAALDAEMPTGHVRVFGKDKIGRSGAANGDGLARPHHDFLAGGASALDL
jgi:hypothetical protein